MNDMFEQTSFFNAEELTSVLLVSAVLLASAVFLVSAGLLANTVFSKTNHNGCVCLCQLCTFCNVHYVGVSDATGFDEVQIRQDGDQVTGRSQISISPPRWTCSSVLSRLRYSLMCKISRLMPIASGD